MEVEKKMRRFPGFDNEKSQNYIFDENIINNLKKNVQITVYEDEEVVPNEEEKKRREEEEKKKTVQVLKSQLGNDANRLDSDLKWMKDSELVGVRDNKETELVFFSYEKEIFFQFEPDSRRFFGMYVKVRPYINNDGEPQTVKTSNGLDVYNFGWNVTEGFNQGILDQKKQQCEYICTMKKCKDTHKLVSIEDVKGNIKQNNPNLKLVDNDGNLFIRRRSPPPYSTTPGGRRTIKKNKKKKSTKRKTKRIVIKKKKLNKGKKSRKN